MPSTYFDSMIYRAIPRLTATSLLLILASSTIVLLDCMIQANLLAGVMPFSEEVNGEKSPSITEIPTPLLRPHTLLSMLIPATTLLHSSIDGITYFTEYLHLLHVLGHPLYTLLASILSLALWILQLALWSSSNLVTDRQWIFGFVILASYITYMLSAVVRIHRRGMWRRVGGVVKERAEAGISAWIEMGIGVMP